jgi:uncharacterized protein YyaL (SSP411 family)
VLFRKDTDEELASKLGMSEAELVAKVNSAREKLFEYRSKRVRPGLDYKVLASWNGLMLRGLCEAYRAFDKQEYLELALKNANFIAQNLIIEENKLRRIFSNEARDWNSAFLDDYANVIDAFIALYEVTFDEQWLDAAKRLTDTAIASFYDEANGMFFYTANDDEQLIARKSEIMDGVIPASTSVMGHNLKRLGPFFDEERYVVVAEQMLRNIAPQIVKYGSSFSNWAGLLLNEVFGINEVAITGRDYEQVRTGFEKNYVPNKIILGGKQGSLPLLQGRFADTTQIFVCRDKICGLPAMNIDDALKQINN